MSDSAESLHMLSMLQSVHVQFFSPSHVWLWSESGCDSIESSNGVKYPLEVTLIYHTVILKKSLSVITGLYASFKIEEKLADSLVFQDGSIEHISPPQSEWLAMAIGQCQ